jgi:hypothetical protein
MPAVSGKHYFIVPDRAKRVTRIERSGMRERRPRIVPRSIRAALPIPMRIAVYQHI